MEMTRSSWPKYVLQWTKMTGTLLASNGDRFKSSLYRKSYLKYTQQYIYHWYIKKTTPVVAPWPVSGIAVFNKTVKQSTVYPNNLQWGWSHLYTFRPSSESLRNHMEDFYIWNLFTSQIGWKVQWKDILNFCTRNFNVFYVLPVHAIIYRRL